VFFVAVAAFAQEADEDLVVPEMELVENVTVAAHTTTYHTETVMQNQTEVTYKPQGKVVQEPVEQVHMVPVTRTVPVKKQVKVETIIKEAAPVKTSGCALVVESCFASPETAAVPAWKAPVLSYEKSYTTLCADEAAAKKAEEKKHKMMEKKTKEAAAKGVSAEKASKKLEKALKEAQVKCSEKSQKGEKTAKEVSKKGAEREEKLFKSEKDSKESAAKAISAANTREKIVYVPSAAPKIVVGSAPAPAPKAAPAPAPAPVVAVVAKKYVCDAKKCQCVLSTNDQGDDFNYCTEMCSTSPGCTPVPAPPAPVPAPPLPKILTNEPAPVQYVKYMPAAAPVAPVAPVPSDEAAIKSQIALKEGMMKAREKGEKSMAESGSKQSEQQMKLSATELRQKSSESAYKEKASKHTTTQESFYKRQPTQRVYQAPVPVEPALQSLEKGTKKVVAMKEKFGKAKLQGVNAIKEAWSKHGHTKKKTNHCKETHEICGKIHTASAARQVTAEKVAGVHAAALEANCAKTVAFAKEEARELTFHICAAAAQKLEGLCHSLSEDFEFGDHAFNATEVKTVDAVEDAASSLRL
jgi:hypothetical protein